MVATPSRSLSDRLELLVAAAPELTGELSLGGVLQQVANIAAEVIGARYAAVGLLNPDGRTLASFTTTGLTPAERELIGGLPKGRGILGLVIKQGHNVRMTDLRRHPASEGFPFHHPPMTTFLGVPILGKRGILGDLYLTEKFENLPFTPEDEHLATLLAALAAAAIENARLHEESARLLEEVQELQRSRERFFAMVNHELRNALAATFGWAEMLVRKKDPKDVPRAAFEVLESAEEAMGLISDLLDLSRLDEDRLKPKLQDIDCVGVIRQAMGRVTPAAESKHVTFEVAAQPEAGICHTDGRRVEQIFLNILTNAVRHTPEGSTIHISAADEGALAVFRVEDAGPGIAEEEIERIFDIYVTKADEERMGSGLGLPLSRRLARLLDGELYAVPQPGKGGCFVLQLPRAKQS